MDFLVDALIKNKHVKKEFKKSVFDRESKGNTDIIHGFAIPHGSYEFVNETTISILVNKSSVNWGNEIVNIIILYAISQEDLSKTKEIIKEILNIVKSIKLQEFINCSSKKIEELFKGAKYDT